MKTITVRFMLGLGPQIDSGGGPNHYYCQFTGKKAELPRIEWVCLQNGYGPHFSSEINDDKSTVIRYLAEYVPDVI